MGLCRLRLIIIFSFIYLLASCTTDGTEEEQIEPQQENKDTIIPIDQLSRLNTISMKGPITEQNIEFTVYLPPTYFSNIEKDFPIVYHLHGLNGKHDGNQINVIPDFMEEAWESGIWEEAVVVFPDGDINSMWSDSMDGEIQIETNIIKEILPYMEENFRVRKEGDQRFIQGFSMGGFGALKLIGRYPDIFGKAISIDGALHDWQTLTTRRSEIAEKVFSGDSTFFTTTADPKYLLGSNATLFSGENSNRLHLSVGALDAYNSEMSAFMNEKNILYAIEFTDCGHVMGCVLDALGPNLFQFYQ